MPMDPHVKLAKLPADESHPEIKQVYQNLIGSLMYAAIMTCPDILYAVQNLSQFSVNPGPTHLTAAKHVFQYLKGTTNLGFTHDPHGHTCMKHINICSHFIRNCINRKPIHILHISNNLNIADLFTKLLHCVLHKHWVELLQLDLGQEGVSKLNNIYSRT